MTESEIKILFGQNLRFLRNKRHLSQMQLADMADVTFNFINDIENGKKWISPATLSKLCLALDYPPYQFFLSVQPSFSEDGLNSKMEMFATEIINQINMAMNTTLENYK